MNRYIQVFQSYRYLYGFLGVEKKSLLVLALLLIMSSLLGIIQVRVTENMINAAVSGVFSLLLCLYSLLCIAAGVILQYGISRLSSDISCRIIQNLKDHIAERILCAEYQQIATFSSGDILTMATKDIDSVVSFLESGLLNMAAQLIPATVAWLYLVISKPVLGLFVFLYTPVGIFLTARVNRKLSTLYPESASIQASFLSHTEQILSNIPVIKSFLLEHKVFQTLKLNQDNNVTNAMQIAKYNALMQTTCGAVSDIPKLLYLIISGILALRSQLSPGFLIAGYDLLNTIIQPTVVLPFTLDHHNRCIASIARIMRLDAIKSTEKKIITLVPESLSINADHISFSYGDTSVFHDLSFHLDGCGLYRIYGGSGTGKTTLLDLIAGLLTPSNGNIFVCGFVPSHWQLHSLVSVIPQDTVIIHGSVYENLVGYGKLSYTQRLQIAPLLSFVDDLPNGYETQIGEGIRELSGGEKQRIALARAMLSDAPIWLCDEITSAIDSNTRTWIYNILQEKASDHLILFCSHDQLPFQHLNGTIDLGGGQHV